MPDIADDAQSEEQLMIEWGLTAIRTQFASQSAVACQQCGDSIPERRRQLLPGVKPVWIVRKGRSFIAKWEIPPIGIAKRIDITQ